MQHRRLLTILAQRAQLRHHWQWQKCGWRARVGSRHVELKTTGQTHKESWLTPDQRHACKREAIHALLVLTSSWYRFAALLDRNSSMKYCTSDHQCLLPSGRRAAGVTHIGRHTSRDVSTRNDSDLDHNSACAHLLSQWHSA